MGLAAGERVSRCCKGCTVNSYAATSPYSNVLLGWLFVLLAATLVGSFLVDAAISGTCEFVTIHAARLQPN